MLVSFVYNLFNSLAEWNSHGLIKIYTFSFVAKAAMLVSFVYFLISGI
ncbi:hypothetical protein SAMN05444380_111117 [Thermophagus xiamenensis]|uniref:Uncharacterized protein n=1 Tax=Thermophagus xiamenensis TaxID=385682 RepID=A0A1I2ANZ4_9BACT|nr:hypothetical protein SAMN05444380_111117 [Thermophagus xiamenensis]